MLMSKCCRETTLLTNSSSHRKTTVAPQFLVDFTHDFKTESGDAVGLSAVIRRSQQLVDGEKILYAY